MAYEYDDQLIDATAVRRERLTAALLYGRNRLRRQWSDRLRTALISAFLTVLICAGCVAVSFVTTLLADDPALASNRDSSEQVPATADPNDSDASPTSSPGQGQGPTQAPLPTPQPTEGDGSTSPAQESP